LAHAKSKRKNLVAGTAQGKATDAAPTGQDKDSCFEGKIIMRSFRKVILYTTANGQAAWHEESVPLNQGKPSSLLSELHASGGYQLRESPIGFESSQHCTVAPQWVFILQGEMQISLADGSSRSFLPGQHFYSADCLPAGVAFDPQIHGHRSKNLAAEPLVTLFVKEPVRSNT
jgi:hypothetical protein